MKNNKGFILICIMIMFSAVMVFTGCPNPADLIVQETATEGIESNDAESSSDTGELNITIPVISSLMLEALGVEYSGSSSESRAIMLARSVILSVYDADDTLVDSYTGSETDTDGYYYVEFSSIPFGFDYYVEVEIYNEDVSESSPVLTGSSSIFDVGPGNNYVYVTPVPVSPDEITMDSSTDLSMKSCAFDFDTEQITAFGAEKWYKLDTSNYDTVKIVVTPDSTSFVYVAAYDLSGYNIDYAASEGSDEGSLGGVAELNIDTSGDDSVYIGVVSGAAAAESHNFNISISECDPASLTAILYDFDSYEGVNAYFYVVPDINSDPYSESVAEASGSISSGIVSVGMTETGSENLWKDTGSWYLYILIDVDDDGVASLGDYYYLDDFALYGEDLTLSCYYSGFDLAIVSDTYEDDNSYSDANEITIDVSQERSIYEAGDEDWIYFYATADTTYTITTSIVDNSTDTYMYLYDDAQSVIDYNDDGGDGTFSQIIYTPSIDETLYIKVSGYSSSIIGYYVLSVTEQ